MGRERENHTEPLEHVSIAVSVLSKPCQNLSLCCTVHIGCFGFGRRYKYNGSDDSIVLHYITNSIYLKLVQFIPAWVAPNLITALGLLLSVVAFCLMAWYCPTVTENAPPWLCFFAAAAGLGYQALDNMDGKQARRHGHGSPFGMLFDHGCDAVNTPMITSIFWIAIQGGEFPCTLFKYPNLFHWPKLNYGNCKIAI